MNKTSTEPKGQIFQFNPNQPDRIYDETLLRKYYKFALIEIKNKNLTLVAEFFNIAQVYFVNNETISTAAMSSSENKREMWFNVNFLLDIVGIGDTSQYTRTTSISNNTPELISKYEAADTYYNKIGISYFCVQRLAFLIAHELMHSLLGHLSNFYKILDNPSIANLAKDVYINNFLHWNKNLQFDASLTEPYLGNENMEWASPFFEPLTEDTQGIYMKKELLKNTIGMTIFEIYDYFIKKLPPEQQKNKISMQDLLGNHSDEKPPGKEFEEQETPGSEAELDLLREFAKVAEASKFNSMFEQQLLISKKPSKELLRALQASAVLKSIQGNIKLKLQSYKKGNHPYSSSRMDPKYLSKSQKAQIMLNKTNPPFFRRYKGAEKTKAKVYLDVSGSIGHMIKALYSILIHASEIFELEIFLFSTTLNPITLADLKAGKLQTTGGTDFECWARDLINGNVNTALIISDGYDHLSQNTINELKSGKYTLNWLIIDGGELPPELKAISKNCWDLKIPQ